MLREKGDASSKHDYADGGKITQEVAQSCCLGTSGGCHVRFVGHSKGGGLALMALHRMLDPRTINKKVHNNFGPFKKGVLSIALYS